VSDNSLSVWGWLGVAIMIAFFHAMVPAARVQTRQVGPTMHPSGACSQWYDTAMSAGWPMDQWDTIAYVMHRESGCDPHAHNPSGATGLMQLLGWRCPPGGCFDPWSNLHEAFVLWQQSGWCPWVLRGDPVTGRACG